MLPADLPALADLFQMSIIGLCEEDYSEEQIEAWAARSEEPAFAKSLTEGLTILAMNEGELAGFASLAQDKIDMLYVHPHHARSGVATALLNALERLAGARGIKALRVDSSDTALPLFEARSYAPQSRNI